jgi:hypothetical protein
MFDLQTILSLVGMESGMTGEITNRNRSAELGRSCSSIHHHIFIDLEVCLISE